MFNNTAFKIKILAFIGLLLITNSCKKDQPLTISDYEYANGEVAVIEINIPKVEGKTAIANTINKAITDFTCQTLSIDASKTRENTIADCAEQFNESYSSFKSELNEELLGELPNWEVFVDGELSYQNEVMLSFAMSATINTGGIKPITRIEFLNFDRATGKQLSFDDLIINNADFSAILESYLTKELHATSLTINRFKTETGTLKNPDQLGYNDAGLIIIYNSLTNGFIEFSIPFSKVNDYLNY